MLSFKCRLVMFGLIATFINYKNYYHFLSWGPVPNIRLWAPTTTWIRSICYINFFSTSRLLDIIVETLNLNTFKFCHEFNIKTSIFQYYLALFQLNFNMLFHRSINKPLCRIMVSILPHSILLDEFIVVVFFCFFLS